MGMPLVLPTFYHETKYWTYFSFGLIMALEKRGRPKVQSQGFIPWVPSVPIVMTTKKINIDRYSAWCQPSMIRCMIFILNDKDSRPVCAMWRGQCKADLLFLEQWWQFCCCGGPLLLSDTRMCVWEQWNVLVDQLCTCGPGFAHSALSNLWCLGMKGCSLSILSFVYKDSLSTFKCPPHPMHLS